MMLTVNWEGVGVIGLVGVLADLEAKSTHSQQMQLLHLRLECELT